MVYCERKERMHCLDRSASLVWALCDGSRNVSGIVQAVVDCVGGGPDVVRADVAATVGHLSRARHSPMKGTGADSTHTVRSGPGS